MRQGKNIRVNHRDPVLDKEIEDLRKELAERDKAKPPKKKK